MAIQKKHGKGRLDKWYRLAKEKGYRSRAAFKLLQINKKYGFLEKSKVLIDLCAAPGGWLQGAVECMPTGSLIIGVDLAPIKPIPGTITFQSDICSSQCRATIRSHLKTWRADVVLHDGAPNVGSAWVKDAFSQSELVLESFRLATDFLTSGGTFVTKVFRSRDYNKLLWVFNQLFTKVEATKPPSSRTVSAEIFVVCRGYKAPKRIDPLLLDPKSVFAELSDPTPNNEAKVFNPEKKKRKREGYEEGDYTQYKEVPASEFIETSDPIAILGSVNRLSFVQSKNGDVALAALDKLPETTSEIRHLCDDLKVLGRKDFKLLLKWRLRAREIFGFSTKKKDGQDEDQDAEEVTEIAPMDEELQLQEDLQSLKERETSKKKRARRKENEKKQKEIVRMQMNMTVPTEIGLEQAGPMGEGAMFKINTVQQANGVDKIARGKMAIVRPSVKESSESEDDDTDEEEDGLEDQLDQMFENYQQRRMDMDAKYRAKKSRTEDSDGEWDGIADEAAADSDEIEEDSDSAYGSEGELEKGSYLQPDLSRSTPGSLSKKAALFFDQDIFKEIEEGEDSEDADAVKDSQARVLSSASIQRTGSGSSSETLTENADISPDEDETQQSEDLFSDEEAVEGEDDSQEEASDPEDKDQDSKFEVVKSNLSDWDKQGEIGQNGRLNIDIITAEAMTLAHQLVSGQKSKHDLLDDSFNRYSHRDKDGLPEWFLEDEGKHSKLQKPITAAAAAAIKEKLRVLNARPIKKVREAKDRKKLRAAQRLEKLKKKSALLADDEGMSEKDKAQSIAKLMSKAAKKKPRKKVTIVVAGGHNKGSGRPKGVKGKYKMVDSRGKKDVRAAKRLAKKRK